MKIFSLPAVNERKALFFDMDQTLYSHDDYAQTQIDLPVRRLAEIKGKTFEQMNEEITFYRKNWADLHNGKNISLGNTFLSFGVSIEENIKWRQELYRPEDYLAYDELLCGVLRELSRNFSLAVVTNNPVSVAVRTLSVLGVHDLIKNITGLDTCFLSKPHREIFLKASQMCGATLNLCIAIGDRYDIDIALPLELGMGGILVDGVEDVYKLPEILLTTSP
ncbi:MAG: HAD family hydrolase [Treponema sp.]|nr:HAD family hydrolase [Treponema sp.]MCL2271917.1 HAD family hydrolase [Treponema sp.]